MNILTPYDVSGRALAAQVYRVSESIMHSTAWWRMYFLKPYDVSGTAPAAQVCVGCQKVLCILLHGVV